MYVIYFTVVFASFYYSQIYIHYQNKMFLVPSTSNFISFLLCAYFLTTILFYHSLTCDQKEIFVDLLCRISSSATIAF